MLKQGWVIILAVCIIGFTVDTVCEKFANSYECDINAVKAAGNVVGIDLTAGEIEQNGYFVVSATARDKISAAAFSFFISFDRNKIRPVSFTGGVLASGSFDSNIMSGASMSELDFASAMWYNASNVEINAGTVLFTIRFRALNGVSDLTTLKLTESKIKKQNFANVDFKVTNTIASQNDYSESFVVSMTSDTLARQSDGKITGEVSYKVSNNTASARTTFMTLSIYDNNDRLLYCIPGENISFQKGDSFGQFRDIVIPSMSVQNYKVKIFCWNSLQDMEPLSSDYQYRVTFSANSY